MPPRIAILLLCHEAAENIASQLDTNFYRSPNVKVYIHHDRSSPHHERAAFAAALPARLNWHWLEPAIHCRWGDYSLVDATLRLMRAALTDGLFDADYLFLASGSCRPIRPLASLQAFLGERAGVDFIEAHDLSCGRWTKGGLEQERFQYFFPFNYQTQRWLFERATAIQRRLGVRRRMPCGLKPHFGSQWFCLTRATAARVAQALMEPAVVKFFSTTWIPDECAIQTMVACLQPPAQIAGYSLTYSEFDAQGKPLVLEDWHLSHVLRQPFFFARKLSPLATRLEAALDIAVQRAESDQGYFARAGKPTPDFAQHLRAAREDVSRRSRIGGCRPEAGGPMAANQRRYYVLYGTVRTDLARVLALARDLTQGPIFDFPFDSAGMRFAKEHSRWWGFGARDMARVRYEPCGLLYELACLDARQCSAFGLDVRQASWLRDFVVNDPHAVLIDCDPPGSARTWCVAEAAKCQWTRLSDVSFADDITWCALTAAGAEVAWDDFGQEAK